MCGRFSLSKSSETVENRFKAKFKNSFKARYNIAPTQPHPIICNDLKENFSWCKWGMVPQWAINEKAGVNLINIRTDNLLGKNTFKHHVQAQRCLVPADGYYEWKKEGKQKIAYRFTLPNDSLFSFAGIWDEWQNEIGETIRTFGILTTQATKDIDFVHERMPVILMPNIEKDWLENRLSENDVKNILNAHVISELIAFKCHRSVNNVNIDKPECMLPAPAMYPGDTYSLF